MVTATSRVAEHVNAHRELEATLNQEDLPGWNEAMNAWEKDPSQPNPFVMLCDAPKQSAVRKELAEAEAKAIAEKKDFSLSSDISPSVLISRGIDLESEQ